MTRDKTGRSAPGAGGAPSSTDDMMAVLLRTQAAVMETVLRQNIETLTFLKLRFEKDRALFAQLAQVQDTGSAITAWSDFWSKAVADYSEETARLGALAAESSEEILGRTEPEAKPPG